MEALFGKKRKPGGVLVLYCTRHGQTQRYAEQIAEPLDALVKDSGYALSSKVKTYDAIVLGLCVYQGAVQGLDFLERCKGALTGKRLVVYTCGIDDPAQPEVKRILDAQVREALGEPLADAAVFHLRGAIRWRSLGILEHAKMKKWLDEIRAKRTKTEMEKQLLEAEGGTIDFSDEVDLAPIVAAARGLGW